MTDPDSGVDRRRGFFGRRKGHRLRTAHARLIETLLPVLALDLSRPAPRPLPVLFPVPVDDVRLEIGFGGGEHLIATAVANPQRGFIGCEPFVNGMAKALAAIAERGLQNVRLHHGDAVALISWLPAQSIAGLDLLYPDPWPKRRHWKRRFVQDHRIVELARILGVDAELRFATDSTDYAAWALIRFLRSPDFAWTAECAADWRQPWAGFVRTRYEAKAVRAGRAPCYLVFRRTQPELSRA
jgi:tRNA (guanine-N7-)-methyltransferase